MSDVRKFRLGPSRAEILHHLQAADAGRSADDIAAAVGLHPNTARFHLSALTASGLVVRDVEPREEPGRPKILFRARARMEEDSYKGLARAMLRGVMSQQRDVTGWAEAAGRAWGDELRGVRAAGADEEPYDRLLTVMTDLGYEPVPETGNEPSIELRSCPYDELDLEDLDVVCQLHLGLMRGVMGPTDTWSVESITPFVTPQTCRVLVRQAPLPAGTPRVSG